MAGRLRSYIAIFLLMVISMVVVPKEFIHALYDHEDTPHDICADHHKGIHVEPAHHNCELLKFQVFPFYASFVHIDLSTEVTRIDFQLPVTSILHSDTYNLSQLRGPPTARG